MGSLPNSVRRKQSRDGVPAVFTVIQDVSELSKAQEGARQLEEGHGARLGQEGRRRGQSQGPFRKQGWRRDTRALGAGEPGAVLFLRCCSRGRASMLRPSWEGAQCEGRWDVRGQSGTWERAGGGRKAGQGRGPPRAERTTNCPYKPARPFSSVFLMQSFGVKSTRSTVEWPWVMLP